MGEEIDFAGFVCSGPTGRHAFFFFTFQTNRFIGVLTCFMAVMTLQLFQNSFI